MRRYAIELSKTIGGFDSEVVSLLAGYSWPGNVRELKAVIERAVLVCNGETVRKDHLSGICG
jgi:NtrC-family two-component system response regulator AlgB